MRKNNILRLDLPYSQLEFSNKLAIDQLCKESATKI